MEPSLDGTDYHSCECVCRQVKHRDSERPTPSTITWFWRELMLGTFPGLACPPKRKLSVLYSNQRVALRLEIVPGTDADYILRQTTTANLTPTPWCAGIGESCEESCSGRCKLVHIDWIAAGVVVMFSRRGPPALDRSHQRSTMTTSVEIHRLHSRHLATVAIITACFLSLTVVSAQAVTDAKVTVASPSTTTPQILKTNPRSRWTPTIPLLSLPVPTTA